MQAIIFGNDKTVYVPVECGICLTRFEDNETYECLLLKCGHIFEERCIQPWLQLKATCPICQCKNVAPISITKLMKEVFFGQNGKNPLVYLSCIMGLVASGKSIYYPLSLAKCYLPASLLLGGLNKDFYQIFYRSLLETPEERINESKVIIGMLFLLIIVRTSYIFSKAYFINKTDRPLQVGILNNTIKVIK